MTDREINKKIDLLSDNVNILNVHIKKLGEIVERLIRLEEKNATLQKDINGYGERLTRFEEEITKISIKIALNTSHGHLIGKWVERLIWFIVITALGVFDIFKSKGHLP